MTATIRYLPLAEVMCRQLERKFEQNGELKAFSGSGRVRSIRIQINLERIRESVVESFETSTRSSAEELGIRRTSLGIILNKVDLHLRSYKSQLIH